MKFHGLAYDLARNQCAKPAHLKRVIDQLAGLDFNLLTLYLEHRFEYASCPGIVPPGSLTKAAAGELVEYGRQRGVEVVPQVNIIGHCEGIGATERYGHLSADPYQQWPWGGYEQLNLDLPEARELADGMLGDICDAFPGEYLFICHDEVRQMDCLYPEDAEKRLAKMIEYIQFTLEAGRRRGRRIIMYGDVPLKYPELMQALPRDIIIADWHYGRDGSRETLERYKAEGFEVLALPAVPTCSAFAVATDLGYQNISRT